MNTTEKFIANISKLGFHLESEDLFLCNDIEIVESEIKFHLEIAEKFEATAVFFKKEIEFFKPQIYIYDFTNKIFEENILTEIHKKVWTSGNVPLVCVFYDDEIKILNTSAPIQGERPNYLEILKLAEKAKGLYNNQFAIKIKTGAFWEAEENRKKFSFTNSAYDILIKHIRNIISSNSNNKTNTEVDVLKKLIIKCILIRFLEEKNPQLFREHYFNNNPFVDLIGNFENLTTVFKTLETEFNGNIFSFSEEEEEQLKRLDLVSIATAFRGDVDEKSQLYIVDWKLYDFKFIPTELISRLYEEFLAGKDDKKTQKEKKQREGIFYTPAHLAKLLVNEAMPLSNYATINLKNYKILDPSCGSGIFLVLAFKRLIQWWRLQQYDTSKQFEITPNVTELKQLMSCIYGVDKEEQATKLTTFSLCIALCDELSPLQIIKDLRFDDLTQTNILYSDFFIEELNTPIEENEKIAFEMQKHNFSKLNDIKFNLVIGNPPFKTGAIRNYSNMWKEEQVRIPQGQIALKFLTDTFPKIKDGGLQCLIIKSSGLLYNSTSKEFRKILFSKYNVSQIYDFTGLARNYSLWENAEVDAIALFCKKNKIDNSKNILQLTFRRTKITIGKIIFEVNKYDRHYINRFEAINDEYVWKNNLLGGGRIKLIIEKLSKLPKFNLFLKKNNIIPFEGEHGAKSIPNNAYLTNEIDEKELPKEYFESFKNLLNARYNPPNLLLKENIALPITLNTKKIPFSNETIGIYSKNVDILKQINSYFNSFSKYLQFYILATSGKVLVYKNTAIKMEDILNLPFDNEIENCLSSFDKQIIDDAIDYFQYFLRNGENSKAVKSIKPQDLKKTLSSFGIEFSKVLNLVYENEGNRFRLSDVVSLFDNTYIATIFKYDDSNLSSNFDIENIEGLHIQNLTIDTISSALSSTKVITMYEENTIIFIKPNQYRYWLSSIAYRDADSCFVDLVKAGY